MKMIFKHYIKYLAVLLFTVLAVVSASSIPAGFIPSEMITSLPWYLTRSSAIVAYLLMFGIILLGTGMTTGLAYRYLDPVRAWSIHQYFGISLGLTLLLHIFSLLFDKFIKFTLSDVLIPFVSDYEMPYLSMGIVGFYILLAIIFSSVFLKLRSLKPWPGLHLLTYPLFVFSLVHGLMLGTDSQSIYMKAVYIASGAIFLLTVYYRFVIYPNAIKSP